MSYPSEYQLKKVVKFNYYTPTNAPHPNCSLFITLECGHTTGRKASQGVPKKIRCSECPKNEGVRL